MATVVDLQRNPKQSQFFNDVMTEVARSNELQELQNKAKLVNKELQRLKELEKMRRTSAYRYFWFGGAVRGGKTYATLAVVILLLKMFPGARAHVIRASFRLLKSTAITSVEKILRYSDVRWNRSSDDYYVEFPNGSRLYFMSENFKNDKDLDAFKGLETNFLILEQVEELQHATYQKCLERVGSWYLDQMPPAFLFSTFNPTFGWIKEQIHDKHERGELEAPHYYLQALPDDNPFVTDDQWAAWDQLDSKTYNRFIKGSWDINIEGAFTWAFDLKKHGTTGLKANPAYDLYLSFDFNVDPMTCTIHQTDEETWFHTIDEIRIANSDTYALCEELQKRYDPHEYFYQITGDATGYNRISGTRGHINHYDIIYNELPINQNQIVVSPGDNPLHSESRVFCNSVLQHFPEYRVDVEKCPELVKDLRFVETEIKGTKGVQIKKAGMNKYCGVDNAQMGHLLDTWRYCLHSVLHWFVKVPKS